MLTKTYDQLQTENEQLREHFDVCKADRLVPQAMRVEKLERLLSNIRGEILNQKVRFKLEGSPGGVDWCANLITRIEETIDGLPRRDESSAG